MDNIKYTTYTYKDENNVTLYSKIRCENKNSHKKTFYFERNENGQTIKNINGCKKILYRLPELIYGINHHIPIFLVEGEKDVDTLLSHTTIATTTTGSQEWHDDFTLMLKDANVVILYDYDKAGLKRKELLCRELYGKVKQLRIVDLPGLEYRDSGGLDITDWLTMGNTPKDLMELVEQTPNYSPEQKGDSSTKTAQPLHIVSLEELLELELPEREMLLHPFLPSQGLVMLVAKRGVGKTHIALGIAYAVSTGSTFLSWTAPSPKKVLYVDGEMPAVMMKERLLMISTMFTSSPSAEYLQLLTPDLQDKPMPDLSHQNGREMLEEYIQHCDLVILDNISCLFRSGYENESESWQETQEWALNLRRQGKSVMFVHHAGKNGSQRGTSKREDILDATIILKHPEDYQSEEGARFEIHFDKARHFTGSDAKSFQAHLQTDGSIWWWEITDAPQEEETVSKEEIESIAKMKNNGLTIKEMTERTSLTKSKVEYRLKKAKARGLIIKK